MPGLVGAAMRRDGFYALFRNTITYSEEGQDGPARKGMVRIKVFNLLLPEVGPLFLDRGIYVQSAETEVFHRPT